MLEMECLQACQGRERRQIAHRSVSAIERLQVRQARERRQIAH